MITSQSQGESNNVSFFFAVTLPVVAISCITFDKLGFFSLSCEDSSSTSPPAVVVGTSASALDMLNNDIKGTLIQVGYAWQKII